MYIDFTCGFFGQVFQLLLHLMGHPDHNVVTGALETFQQFLRHPSPLLVSLLTTPKSIPRSYIYRCDQDLQQTEGTIPGRGAEILSLSLLKCLVFDVLTLCVIVKSVYTCTLFTLHDLI